MSIHDLIFNNSALPTITIIIGAILSLIQLSPIKFNPWSAIGNVFNKDVLHRLSGLEQQLNEHIKTDAKQTAGVHRSKILRFNNEMIRREEHTREEFEDIMADIDEYEKYCNKHPDYPNNRATCAIENIKESYNERMHKSDFL